MAIVPRRTKPEEVLKHKKSSRTSKVIADEDSVGVVQIKSTGTQPTVQNPLKSPNHCLIFYFLFVQMCKITHHTKKKTSKA